MRFEKVKELKGEEFRRLTGVKRSIFSKMVEILIEEEGKKKARGGKPSKKSMEERLLMTLEYLREYRTYFHIGQNYGMSESGCYRSIKWIEDTLIKHPDFALPGRKELLKRHMKYEILALDATETPIERPKKNKKDTTQGKKRDTV